MKYLNLYHGKLILIIFLVGFFGFVTKASAVADGQYFKGNGGYGSVADSSFVDLDYSKDFSVEAVIDVKPYENLGGWTGIVTKTTTEGIYSAGRAGWALGLYQDKYNYGASIKAKVGDGLVHSSLSSPNTYIGRIHLVMTWNTTSKTVTLYVNGLQVATATNADIALEGVENGYDFWLGKSLGILTSPVLFARIWNRDLSLNISTLYDYYNTTKQHELPQAFDREGLLSEWLMFDESDSSGNTGTTHIKDTSGQNHIQLINGADIVSSVGALMQEFPVDGAINQNKTVTLKVIGGYDTLSAFGTVKGPLQYYFQIDKANTFDSVNLKESGWISDIMAWQPTLEPSTVYYWRVKASDSNTVSLATDYTNSFSFTTEGTTNWYARPAEGSYGSENGSSYENAWDGLTDLVWGEYGIEAGDTLYIAGLHVFDMKVWKTPSGSVIVNASGLSNENPITIRGDYSADPGVIWGASKPSYSSWNGPDVNGVYNMTLTGGTSEYMFFEDVSQNSFTILDRRVSIADVAANPGSTYLDGQVLYIKTTDGGNPTGRILTNGYGHRFVINTAKYIKFLNFEWYNPGWSCGGALGSDEQCSHITWDGLTMAYGNGNGNAFNFYDNMDYMEVANSDISWFPNGIYNISNTNNSPNNYLYKGNKIHAIGVRPGQQNGDAHCIGIQGGDGGIIENNECYNAGSGPLLYAFKNQTLTNNIVRNNYVHNLHTLGSATAYGVSTMCDNDSLSDKTGNKFYGNIITDCSIGLRLQFEDIQEVYNNTVAGCTVGYTSSRSYLTYGPRTIFKNNLIANSGSWHINFATGAIETSLESDYNLFYPDGADKFVKSGFYNFSSWQAKSQTDFVFDPNSIVSDPLLANASGDFSAVTDFQPTHSSPHIDAGNDTGQSTDHLGNPIYGPPDIGAIEYQPPYNMGIDKVDIAADIRVYGDGKFRNTKVSSGTTANLSIDPVSDDISRYLDISNLIWEAERKQWTESSSAIDGGVLHVVGDLTPNSKHTLKIDDLPAISNITSDSCTNGLCTADELGKITFTYTGGYSSHTFELVAITIRSDVDNSSVTNTTDALLTLRNSLGLSMTATAWQSSATTGDVNCDGVSNSTDALLILRYSLGLAMESTAWCE